MLLRMALRNLLRRPIQSALCAMAVAAGLAMTVFITNFQHGSWASVLQDTVQAMAGHVVVQPKGFQDGKDLDLLLDDTAAIADSVRAAVPGATVLRRAFLQGLLASPTNTVAVAVNAVEPVPEAAVSRLPEKLIEGEWLAEGATRKVIVGKELAKKLGSTVGSKVVLMVNSGGEIQAAPLRIGGIFETGSMQTDSFFAVVPLVTAQGLLPEHSDPATQIALQLDSLRVPPATLAAVQTATGGPEREVLHWHDAIPELLEQSEVDKAGGDVVWVALAAIVSIGVLNVLLMSLFHRTRELGVMKAVGMRPSQVARLLAWEGALIGLAGAVLGLVVGLAFSWPIVHYGIDLAAMQTSAPTNVAVDTLMKGQFMWARDLSWAGFFLILSVLASLWPAMRAARLQPVDAMRHV